MEALPHNRHRPEQRRHLLLLPVLLGLTTLLAVQFFAWEFDAVERHGEGEADASAAATNSNNKRPVSFDPRYPEELFATTDWSQYVPEAERLHHSRLQTTCMEAGDTIIAVGDNGDEVVVLERGDARVVEELRQCPPVDVLVPVGIRGHGYCEDAAAYAKYLRGRILPVWVLKSVLYDRAAKRPMLYHDLCPQTPMIVLGHYWSGARADPQWPPLKPLLLMPNIEMYELEAKHYHLADFVLCKTAICAEYVTRWYEQEGNPRRTEVLYTRHTTSDIVTRARAALAMPSPPPIRRDFDQLRFIHTAGGSNKKGTDTVLDCWLSRPDLPRLDVHIHAHVYRRLLRDVYDEAIRGAPNIRLFVAPKPLDPVAFGLALGASDVFLCTSVMEGYGHYINQARATGGLVLVPNVPPMNELVTPSSGVLLNATTDTTERQFLGGASTHPQGLKGVDGFLAMFDGRDVCAGVDRVLQELTPSERRQRGERARQQYFYDTVRFAQSMRALLQRLQELQGGVVASGR